MGLAFHGGMVLFLLACSDYELSKPGDGSGADGGTEWEADTGGGAAEDTEEPAHGDGYLPGVDDDGPADGAVVTILLTINDAFVPRDVARALTLNAVAWVAPVSNPHILVIRDDNHSGEDVEDSEQIVSDCQDAGWGGVLIEEPADGIGPEALAGYDVAILSNPGHPPDDVATIEALTAFSAAGFGVIFQGDDMTRFADGSNTMEPITRLRNVDNGTEYYGYAVDDDETEHQYAVTLGEHPLMAGLEGTTFLYGNDIDTTQLVASESVVAATAEIAGADTPEKAAIVGWRLE